MKKISADYIFPVSSPPIKNGVITVSDEGKILDLGVLEKENDSIEKFRGIIVPGFVNAHCHLELSYLKNKIGKNKGLDEFIREVEKVRRGFSEAEVIQAASEAENEMFENGIVAVGDISNFAISFSLKEKGKLWYHTFIELLGFHSSRAESAFNAGLKFSEALKKMHLSYSLTPHAPYSASPELLHVINDFSKKNKSILSIHLAESSEEEEMFSSGTGKILDRIKSFGIDTSGWNPPQQSSLQWILPQLTDAKKILLVHNTYLSKEDIDWLKLSIIDRPLSIFFCFCPSANLYIENRLPDYKLFNKFHNNITVGTDSLASNSQLSILEELKIISKADPSISLTTLIQWASLNGAKFLGMDHELGSIEKNKKPGLNLIEHTDLDTMKLTEKSKVRKIV